ncbi:MAG: dTDP-4-dehydrorhamnose 3,5-epimerase [Hyphomonadaceae bacterium]|nr:dTDP-4-dehydrorhamnose 3,5-epimerase [Hyphomonadaceae bacterium]
MQFVRYDISGPVLITPKEFADDRGAFTESYSRRALAEAIGAVDFVQDNQSLSHKRGTVRGLHLQTPPAAQAKLVRVVQGSIFDVAVDLRPNSPTYKRYVTAELTAGNRAQLFVPAGFAHGFCTLEPETIVQYKVDAYYSPTNDRSIFWLDPELAVPWPIKPEQGVLSDKDAKAPLLKDIEPPFAGWGA